MQASSIFGCDNHPFFFTLSLCLIESARFNASFFISADESIISFFSLAAESTISFFSLATESIESFFSSVVSAELLHAANEPANAKMTNNRFMVKRCLIKKFVFY